MRLIKLVRLLCFRQLLLSWPDKRVGLLASGITLMALANLPRQLLNPPTHWLIGLCWLLLLVVNCWMATVAGLLWREYLLRQREYCNKVK